MFNAVSYMFELQRRGVVVNVDSFLEDYMEKGMVPFGTDQDIVIMALEMFRDQGVSANCNGRQTRVHMSGHEFHQGMDADRVFAMIRSGTPLMGIFKAQDDFDYLGSGIYEINPDGPVPETHIVMFVGYGDRKGHPYLVFLNSYGKDWGTGGLGRVFFDQVYQMEDSERFQLITVRVDREAGTSLDLAEPPTPDDELVSHLAM